MKYSVKLLAKQTGVSIRTLHLYDEKGLLKPSERNKAGHRIYGQYELHLLQKILFYKNLGFSLDEIKKMLYTTDWKRLKALKKQKELLMHQQKEQERRLLEIERVINQLSQGTLLPLDQKIKRSAA